MSFHSTPQLTHRTDLGRNAALATLGVLIAIGVAAIFLALGSSRTVNPAPQVVTNSDTGAAYAPPHDFGVVRATSVSPTIGLSPNHQAAAAWRKAELYSARH
jgi:hypothetical protein